MSSNKFHIATDSIDPKTVPMKILSNGAKIPMLGLGTFGSDNVPNQAIADAVLGAASVGYRHFDCASVYGNEDLIGHSFKAILEGGIKRSDLWVTSKVWNDKHKPEDVIASCQKTLKDLQLNYLDLYLVHWPFPNFHPPHCDVSSRSKDAKPYIHENYMKTWAAMEKLVDMGLVKSIGTSNMTIPKLDLLLRDCTILPVVNEMELHPHFQQPELFKYCINHKIAPIGYSPIGSPARPERDRTTDDTVDVEDPVILDIAKRLNIHPAVVCVKWAIQRGQIPIPFSVKHYKQNLMGAVSPPLSQKEMDAIAKIDKNCRLIKGQVFLWKENQSWEALWDLDGKITPP
jgi:diketogulonate reductase-like aldo/keto reductase